MALSEYTRGGVDSTPPPLPSIADDNRPSHLEIVDSTSGTSADRTDRASTPVRTLVSTGWVSATGHFDGQCFPEGLDIIEVPT